MSARTKLARLSLAALCATVGIVSGCGDDKPVYRPPPIGERVSTSDSGMREPVLIDVLNEMIDETAQYLTRELPNVPAVKQSPNQMVFAVPPNFEHDSRIPDGGVREALASLKSKLQQSELFKGSFVVITGTQAENNTIINQVAGNSTAFRDPLQRTADRTKAESYDPATVYVMTGKFYQQTDPDPKMRNLRDYRLFIRVTHPQSREQTLDHEFHRTLKWDPTRGRWNPAS